MKQLNSVRYLINEENLKKVNEEIDPFIDYNELFTNKLANEIAQSINEAILNKLKDRFKNSKYEGKYKTWE